MGIREMLQSALFLVAAIAPGGCGAGSFAAGSTHGDLEHRMEGPVCYRETKSRYEAAATGSDPNAALINIGMALSANDGGLEQCAPVREPAR